MPTIATSLFDCSGESRCGCEGPGRHGVALGVTTTISTLQREDATRVLSARHWNRSGYVPERTFNATHGARRLLYHAGDGSFHIDVFIDEFSMSHKLVFGDRLDLEPLTLPAAELLATKLQIAEINPKDIGDVLMLLLSHSFGHEDVAGTLNVDQFANMSARDWGFHTTVVDNLSTMSSVVGEFLSDEAEAARAREAVAQLQERVEAEPKSRAWKLRSKIGRRVRWYELPEDISR